MKNTRKIRLAALLVALLTLATSCAVVPELEKGGRTVIYAPTPDGPSVTQSNVVGDVPPETTAPTPTDTVYSFLAAGDNIIHQAVFEDAHKRVTDPATNYNFTPMYDGVADLIASADIAFVNQEGPIAGSSFGISGYPNFNAPNEAGNTLVELGFDIVNIANNHMLDKWESGLLTTIEYWEQQNVLLLGGYRDREDYDNIRVYTCPNGTKIAWLSYTYGTNGMRLNDGSQHVIPSIIESDITRQLSLAKQVGDLVFVSIHWGEEDHLTASGEQHTLAQLMTDNGADVIVGHHPHVLQEVEWLTAEDGSKTLVIYSLGNMISTMHYSQNMVGAFATFDIRISGTTGEATIEDPKMIPTMCHYSTERDGLQLYKLEDYTEELMMAHGSQLKRKFTMDTLYGYVTDTIAAEFLPDSFLAKVGGN